MSNLNSNCALFFKLVIVIQVASLLLVSGVFAGEDDAKFDFSGDFRYLFERTKVNREGLEPRDRHRIRARFGFEIRPADEVQVAIQVASGSDDLVSSNQTLSGTFSSKRIVLDLAYAEYRPPALSRRLKFTAGKSVLPFFRPGKKELLWDSDLRPEGISAQYDLEYVNFDMNILGGYFILEERENDNNSYLYATQLVGTIRTFKKLSSLKAGVGYFYFTEIADRLPFIPAEFSGNSSYADTTSAIDPTDPPVVTHKYLNEYHELELFLEAGLLLGQKPILLTADYVINTTIDNNNIGWLVGVRVGEVTGRGVWSARYNFRWLEADAIFASFSDSNFKGGGTDGKGHELKFGIGVSESTKLSLAYYHNWIGLEHGDKYQRLALDLSTVF